MTKKDRQLIFDKYKGKCAYCGCDLQKGWHVDEIEPVRRNHKWNSEKRRYEIDKDNPMMHPERLHIDNQNPSCASCNINKHSESLEDFRKAIKSISLSEENNIEKAFFYCDPPYLGTNDNYSNSFTEQDSIDLFDCLQATGCKFAMSEFDNEFILNQAKERGLNVIVIGERKNLKNRRTEILITNYEKQKSLFD